MARSCPICSFPIYSYKPLENESYINKIVCYKCGEFNITKNEENYLIHYPLKSQESSNLSGWLISNQNYTFQANSIKELRGMKSIYVDEKAEILFREIVKKYSTPGENIPDLLQLISLIIYSKSQDGFPKIEKYNVNEVKNGLYFYAISRSQNLKEFIYLFDNYIVQHKKYLTKDGEHYKITPDGWSFFSQIQNPNQENSIAFIAMKYEDKLMEYSDKWFESAMKNAGYRPIRIDKHESNNLIDDAIIANIRKSKFVVADFTYNSSGVYYESGFARGLNIPVIYLCNKECFAKEETKVHFDTNHYSFLLWEWDKGKDLSEKLRKRIEATIGKGDYIDNVG